MLGMENYARWRCCRIAYPAPNGNSSVQMSPDFSPFTRSSLLFDGIRRERDLNETSPESDTYFSCPSTVHCLSIRPPVCQSSITKLIQIPENPLLFFYRTAVKVLTKDTNRWNARNLALFLTSTESLKKAYPT